MTRSGSAVAVMAKEPRPGNVKTRLCPPLSPREAADLAAAFLLDTLDLVAGTTGVDLFLAYDPPSAREFFAALVPVAVACVPQGTGDLGGRLSRVSRGLFARGYARVVLLASDTPHLPPGYVDRALSRLGEVDVVLGPCDDGGYSLLGSRIHEPGLFEGIAWSTPAVLDQTIARAERTGMTWELLPPCHDIDTIEDLERLVLELRAGDGERVVACPRTRAALGALRRVVPGGADL